MLSDQLLEQSSQVGRDASVRLSHELVALLSEQLYRSPLKALEELVVNGYDAEATECRVYVPSTSHIGDTNAAIAVFDNGTGMDANSLIDLWHIGRSAKVGVEQSPRLHRRMIGRFGIGKLATYAVGERLTYVSKKDGECLWVTIDFSKFSTSPTGASEPIALPIRRLPDVTVLTEAPVVKELIATGSLLKRNLNGPSWTLAIIERLKDKAREIREGRLRWVLSTAMPLHLDFDVFLNGERVESSLARVEKIVEFSVAELGSSRLASLKATTGQTWRQDGDRLYCDLFPSGISGTAFVASDSLHGGKAEDILRSHGFFVRVNGRLINQSDALFGAVQTAFTIWYRFRCDIYVDDLHRLVSASREDIQISDERLVLVKLLNEIVNHARALYDAKVAEQDALQQTKKEHDRQFVAPRLVEHPIADALTIPADGYGPEADDSSFYLDPSAIENVGELAGRLYGETRSVYKYSYSALGRNARFVRFSPVEWQFVINTDHEFAQAHFDEGRARALLEDIATAEVMLEVYLRLAAVPPLAIGDVLSQRDLLLRSLARERRFSLATIATSLRDAAAEQYDLEIALVSAVRALGFVATHVSGSGEPDGVARFRDYPAGETLITLEAKSSKNTPSLAQIDFAGLDAHRRAKQASACLLVAPSYPGLTKADASQAALRAKEARTSCWTIEQLAKVVEAAEARQFSATTILDIVTNAFAPSDVAERVVALLEEPKADRPALYKVILEALRGLEETATDGPRNVSLIIGRISVQTEFRTISEREVEGAVSQLAAASKGAMTLRPGGQIVLHASVAELERRVVGLTGDPGSARKPSNLRGERS